MDEQDTKPKELALAPDLTDEDVFEAMGQLPGYLDITTEDFRALYRLSFEHAMGRLVGRLRARDLMRAKREALAPEMPLVRGAEIMVVRRVKSIPVVDAEQRVIGVLSETDVLRLLGAMTSLELLLQPPDKHASNRRLLHDATVGTVMVRVPVSVTLDADFGAILQAFQGHNGRQMPVVDDIGRLAGVLARKDFIAACPLSMAP